MAHRVRAADGQRGIALPNGNVIRGGEANVISDEQFNRIETYWFTNSALLDEGETDDPLSQSTAFERGSLPIYINPSSTEGLPDCLILRDAE